MTSPFFIDDAPSSSQMMSMPDRQNQLVEQRRQMIRRLSSANSNLSGRGNSHQKLEVGHDDLGDCKPSPAPVLAHRTISERVPVHAPSELSCTTTSRKYMGVATKTEEGAEEDEECISCGEISNDSNKENQAALPLLEQQDSQKKVLNEHAKKVEHSPPNEKDTPVLESKLSVPLSSAAGLNDDSSQESKEKEITNVSTTCSLGGSDGGYQRYLEAYHYQPKPILTKQSDETDISGLTGSGSRKLSSTSSSRPISRARRRSLESSLSSFASTREETNLSSRQAAAVTESFEGSNDQEQQQKAPTLDSFGRSLPSLQRQLSSITSANLDDPVVMRSIIMNQCPKDGGMIQCCVRRSKGTKSIFGIGLPEYRCYLKGNNNSRTETFLMTSKKRAANKTSNYLISMGINDHDKESNNILGKLRGNFFDTEYILYDNGKNPEDCSQDVKGARAELGAILYAPSTSSLGSKGPRTISVCINNIDEGGNPTKIYRKTHKHDESMLDYLKKIDEGASCKDEKCLICLQSKPPAWDAVLERFFLNFSGRVTMASVKNFQLVDEKDNMCLQFGRTGKDEFILDVGWPLSPFQGFAFALSSFDSKVGCD